MSNIVDNIDDELENNMNNSDIKKENIRKKVEEMKQKMKDNKEKPKVRRERFDLNTKQKEPEITSEQIVQYQTIQRFSECVNNGEMISSIFINNNNNWYSDNFIQQMWIRYMLQSDLFKIKFPYLDTSIYQEFVKENFFDQDNIKRFDEVWQPLFNVFLENGVDEKIKNYSVLFCTSNDEHKSNVVIIFDKEKFSVLSLNNSQIAVDKMNEMLKLEDQSGNFAHVIICKQ